MATLLLISYVTCRHQQEIKQPSIVANDDCDPQHRAWLMEQKRRKDRIKEVCENYKTKGGLKMMSTHKRRDHYSFLYEPVNNVMTCLQPKCGTTFIMTGEGG